MNILNGFIPWDRIIAFVTLLVDVGILWILVVEFDYDKTVYEKEEYKKRNARKRRFTLPEAGLNDGEAK